MENVKKRNFLFKGIHYLLVFPKSSHTLINYKFETQKERRTVAERITNFITISYNGKEESKKRNFSLKKWTPLGYFSKIFSTSNSSPLNINLKLSLNGIYQTNAISTKRFAGGVSPLRKFSLCSSLLRLSIRQAQEVLFSQSSFFSSSLFFSVWQLE